MPKKMFKLNHQTITINYRNDSDLSVIDEIFVDKMYRSVESTILNTKYPILDIGAHIGLFSIYTNILNPQVQIIALEPEPNNFALMIENFKLNHVKNVVTKCLAVIPNECEKSLSSTTLYLNQNSHNHSTIEQLNHSTITVPATTLENLIAKNKLKKIGLLKMDIEGAEFDIIKTLKPENIKTILNLVVEYHEDEINKRVDLENIFRSHGFSVEHFPNYYDKRFGLLVARNKRIHSS